MNPGQVVEKAEHRAAGGAAPADRAPAWAGRETILWSGVCALYAGLAVAGVLAPAQEWMSWVVASRLLLASAAAGAAAWLASGRRLPEDAVTVFFFLALGLQSAHAVLEGPGRDGFLLMTGVLFVLTAAVFRSDRRDWLSLFLPLCAALLFVPALLKEDLAGALVMATVALVLGQAVAWLRQQRERAESGSASLTNAIESRNEILRKLRRASFEASAILRRFEDKGMNTGKPSDDKALVRDLQSPLRALQLLAHADDELSPTSKRLMDDAIQRIRAIADQFAGASSRRERATDPVLKTAPPVPVQAVGSEDGQVAAAMAEASALELTRGEGREQGLGELVQMIDACLERKRSELARGPRKVTLSWLRGVDRQLPVKVQINDEDFVAVIGSLIDQGVEALGGNDGVVNVGLRPGLTQIQITVEDNGRGFSDEIVQRMQMRGLLRIASREGRLSFKQIKALINFWGGRVERQARLGVGSRVCIELPRVDAYATPFASQRQAVAPGAASLATMAPRPESTTLNVLS